MDKHVKIEEPIEHLKTNKKLLISAGVVIIEVKENKGIKWQEKHIQKNLK